MLRCRKRNALLCSVELGVESRLPQSDTDLRHVVGEEKHPPGLGGPALLGQTHTCVGRVTLQQREISGSQFTGRAQVQYVLSLNPFGLSRG